LLDFTEDLYFSACQEVSPQDVRAFIQPKQVNHMGVLFITANQGLCAGFNLALNHELERFEKHLRARKVKPRYYVVGKKGIQFLDRRELPMEYTLVNLKDKFAYEEITALGDQLRRDLHSGHIDDLSVIYTHYMTGATYKVVTEPLFPWKTYSKKIEAKEPHKDRIIFHHPSIPELFQAFQAEVILNRLYKALLESMLCEQIIRRIAMKQATDAAEDMIDELSGLYHKIRKARITQEVNEMMGTVLAIQKD
jgi:F-type H+-transporting ATPase subunit gamma